MRALNTFLLIAALFLFCGAANAANLDALTLKDVKQTGAQPLTSDQIRQLVAKGKIEGETRKWSHLMRLFDDGKLKVEGCPRGSRFCSSPGRATGTWAVEPDGVFVFTQDWSGDKGEWKGSLYPVEGKYLFFPVGAADDAPWSYLIN